MSDKYVLAHDMGTSGTKAVLVSVYGEIIDMHKETYPLYHPAPGYAEQDPLDWWEAVCKATRSVLGKNAIDPEQIVGVTFSSQVQSLIPVNKAGDPLCRALTWLDVRSAEILHEALWTHPRIMGYNIFHLFKDYRREPRPYRKRSDRQNSLVKEI